MEKRYTHKIKRSFFSIILLITIFTLGNYSVSANVEGNNNSLIIEQINSSNVTINMDNATLTEVLTEIKRQSKIGFAIDKEVCDEISPVSINFSNKSIATVLDSVLEGTGYKYVILNNQIVFKQEEAKPIPQQQPTQIEVNGRVIDTNGDIVVGATVIVANSSSGAITDNNGKFTLSVAVGAVLEISFTGLKSTTHTVTATDNNLTITLGIDEQEISDVVVTGYQSIKKDRMAGNTETLTTEDLENAPFTSVDNLLAGKVAGLASFMSSGRAGSNSDIRIRGVNTLSGTTQPLWIVDGLPMQGEVPNFQGSGASLQDDLLTNGIGNIPPSDIQSITVLKDAAATAIYGARAANGVIVITTKKPVAGNISLTYNSSISISESPSVDLDFMDGEQKVAYELALYEEFGDDSRFSWSRAGAAARIAIDRDRGIYTSAEANTMLDELRNTNTNWLDEIYNNSFSHTHNFSISAGTEKMQYYASLNYQDEQGTLLNDNYDNFTGRISTTYKPNRIIDIRLTANQTYRTTKYHSSSISPFTYAVYGNPYYKPYNEDGSYAWDETYTTIPKIEGTEQNLIPGFNIINEIENTHKNTNYSSGGLSIELNLWLMKGLKLSSKGVYTRTSTNIENIAGNTTITGYNGNWIKNLIDRDPTEGELNGYYKESASFTTEYSMNNTLEYSKDIKNWFINALAGQEISSVKSDGFNVFMPDYLPEYDIVGYPDIKDIDGSMINLSDFGGRTNGEKRYSSFFFSGSAGWKERYIFNFNARYDGADIIGDANRFTPLWSASGRWNLHNEEWFEKQTIFNELHIKGQYGYTGNINRTAYPFTVITLSEADRYKDEVIASYFTHPNPSIKWEQKREIGVSLAASMFDYRFNFSVAYYDNLSTDVLSLRRLPISSGVTSLYANISDVANKGLEVSANVIAVRNRDLTVSVSGNVSYNENKLANVYYNSLDDVTIQQVLGAEMPLVNGYGVGSIYGVKAEHVNPETGDWTVWVNEYIGEGNADKSDPNNYQVNLVDRGTVYEDDDRPLYLGNTNPTLTGGFGFNVRYKQFNLSTNFIYEAGHLLPKFSERLSSPGGSTPTTFAKYNVLEKQMYRWQNPGDITDVEKYEQYLVDQIPMSVDYEKGDYLKLRNITLSYTLPIADISFLNWAKMLRMSLQADNLFTATGYGGIDPELRTDFGYPIPRSYRFSLHLTF